MPTIRFSPLGKMREVRPGTSILAAANRCEVPLGQSCSGDGICGWCRVRIVDGAEGITPPSPAEERLIREKGFASGERAACLARVSGDVTVTTSYW